MWLTPLHRTLTLVPVIVASAVACGGGENITAVTTGTLVVIASTTGTEPDGDGYTVILDDQPAERISPNGTLRRAELAAGDHTVELGDLAPNCSVTAENPRIANIQRGETTSVTFTITCSATTGSLRITSATSGVSPDPDGYSVLLDGSHSRVLGVSAEVTFEGVTPGAHSIGLSSVAANCRIEGNNPRSVVVAAGATATLAFAVNCAALPPSTGSLRVTTTTSGSDQDLDGYAVAVDGGPAQPIGLAASVTLVNLESGVHTVQLSGVTANCTLAGTNPRSVMVPSGGMAEVSFNLACITRPPTSGTLQITTVTTGAGSDPDGYGVSVDGGTGQPIGVNASLPIPGLAPGVHSVGLSGVSDNCVLTGENPTSTTVTAGEASLLAFNVVCGASPPGTGTLNVSTATSGPDADPDGYALAIDGGPAQSVGVNAAVSVANLPAGPHTVGLAGIAGNCIVEGANPQTIAVPAGGSADVSFSVTCVAGVGSLTVTTASTGSPADPDGYSVSVDGGTTQPIADNASYTVAGLTLGLHAVALSGLAANCEVVGENPRSVTIAAAETATIAFTVTCLPTTGGLAVTISGLPAGTDAAVTVTGPDDYSQVITATRALTELTPGTYVLTAAAVTVGGATYTPSSSRQEVSVAAGAPATVTVTYGTGPAPSLNLRIDGLYITQSTQTYNPTVPLVQDRDGYLRVFVVANETNAARPSLRVRFYRNGVLSSTSTIVATAETTPIQVREEVLGNSWNIPLPPSLIQPGLTVLADVDPDNTVAESNESDNIFPVSGTPQALDVRAASTFAIRFVPVRQRANGLQGDVSDGNKDQFLDQTRRIYPLPAYDADVHAVYTTTITAPLQSGNDNGAWSTILSEVYTLRIVEGSSRYYYGVVRLGHNIGIAGVGYVGAPAALGYDDVSDRSRVAAHELGHNWNRQHSPCGNPGGPDPQYPYAGGLIGVFGFDVAREALRPPYYSDIMGYCSNPWISDYTYKAVLAYRAANPVVGALEREEPCLLVWGRIVDGQPVLEPAFRLVTRPKVPSRTGPYRIEGYTSDGAPLFSLSFHALEVADDPRGSRHFAFAVPLDEARAARLESLRLGAPGAPATRTVRPTAQFRVGPMADSIIARRTGRSVALHWNATAYPMLMVRDPDTGEVLSFARGGDAEVTTTKGELDVLVSDKVQSRRIRVAVTRP